MSDLGRKPWYKEMSSWEEADGEAESQAALLMRKEEAEGQARSTSLPAASLDETPAVLY